MVPPARLLRRVGRSDSYKLLDFSYLSTQHAAQSGAAFHLNRADLVAGGHVAGYQGDYVDACGGVCSPGVLNISTEVHVFKTSEQASRFIADQEAMWGDLEGRNGRYGVRVTSAELFNPGLLGEQAAGVRTRQIYPPDEPILETVIVFRVSEVVALVNVAALKVERHPDRQAATLARNMEQRVQAVLVRTG